MNNIVTRPVIGSRNETEFDFIHPKTEKRVRRKIKAEPHVVDMVKKILENLMQEENLSKTRDDVEAEICNNSVYHDCYDEIMDYCDLLFFRYSPDVKYIDQETEAAEILDGIFTEPADINITFLGKAGVGKSSIINKMSCFSDKSEIINFPFVDTSRTTVYAADYVFVPESDVYRCGVVFLMNDIISLRVDECIDRAVCKAIELHLKPDDDTSDSVQDKVISAFYDDPSQQFDLRLCFGKHIKTTSKNYDKHENKPITNRWDNISRGCIKIAKATFGKAKSPNIDSQFYQEQYSEGIKTNNLDNPIFSAFNELKEFIMFELFRIRNEIHKKMNSNNAITDFIKEGNYFHCYVTYSSIQDFSSFVSLFTSKSIHVFGNSLLPLVYKLKIEIPYNTLLSEKIRQKRICCSDTVGVAHTTESSGGFERSTSLNMDNVDAVIIADDSKLNMDNNTGIILRHIASRVDYRKIFFAMTFFDDFTKQEFDQDEDKDEQKIEYLSKIHRERVSE